MIIQEAKPGVLCGVRFVVDWYRLLLFCVEVQDDWLVWSDLLLMSDSGWEDDIKNSH